MLYIHQPNLERSKLSESSVPHELLADYIRLVMLEQTKTILRQEKFRLEISKGNRIDREDAQME